MDCQRGATAAKGVVFGNNPIFFRRVFRCRHTPHHGGYPTLTWENAITPSATRMITVLNFSAANAHRWADDRGDERGDNRGVPSVGKRITLASTRTDDRVVCAQVVPAPRNRENQRREPSCVHSKGSSAALSIRALSAVKPLNWANATSIFEGDLGSLKWPSKTVILHEISVHNSVYALEIGGFLALGCGLCTQLGFRASSKAATLRASQPSCG